MKPILSLCIFTYNRASLLKRCLQEVAETVKALPFPVEVLCLDTGSTDDTRAVMQILGSAIPNFRPIRFDRRLPEHEALFAAARMARGEFFFWLPDDDRLEPAGLAKALAELQADPRCVASFSPQIEVEDGTDRRVALLNEIPAARRFHQNDLYTAASYLLSTGYHPELPLCRTDALRRTVTRPRKSFLGYWLLLSLLKAGDVQLRTEGFFIHRLRPQGGTHDQVQWTYATDRMDQHRLAFEILKIRTGFPGGPPDAISLRMAGYAQTAANVSARAGQWQAALEFSCRTALAGPGNLIIGSNLAEMQALTLPLRLAEEISERYAASPDRDHILLAGMGGLAEPVRKALSDRAPKPHLSGAYPFLVVDTDDDRQWHIRQGVEPWHVIALADLAQALEIAPGDRP